MFAEWELIGVPVRLTVGDRGLANGEVELMARRDTQPALVKLEQAVASTQAALSH
jgi:prolyl-tRNA synthetase